MKKFVSGLLVLGAIIMGFTIITATNGKPPVKDAERLEAVIKTLLMPKIQDAINTFYESYLSALPQVAPYYGMEIVDIGESNRTDYTVTLEVTPYVGPHLDVGKDRLTFHINVEGNPTLKEFVHLQNYALPPNYQFILKKPLP